MVETDDVDRRAVLNTALYADELNTESARRGTIVFLPGGGLSGWSWRPVAEQLGEYRTLLVDLPEHGRSASSGLFTITRAARNVAQVIKDRAGGKAHVVGLSLGGQVAIQLIAMAPDVVESAFVSGCPVRSLPIPGLRSYRHLKVLCHLYPPLRKITRLVRTQAYAIGVPRERISDFTADVRLWSPGLLARIVSENQAFRVPPELHEIEVPVLIAVGEKELRTVKHSAIDLVRTLRHAKAYIVRGRAHTWPIADARLCADALRAFLTGGSLPPSFAEMHMGQV